MEAKVLEAWVSNTPDVATRELRMAVHTVIAAVSKAPRLPKLVVLKGGILLALEYNGDRFTRDIDFSVKESTREVAVDGVIEELRIALQQLVEELDYGLDCRIQSQELRPPGEGRNWQTLKIRIGYAPKADGPRHRSLLRGRSSSTVALDLSYNEVITAIELVPVPGGGSVQASALTDLMAEKYRAMLQQPVRHRDRRQNVYDLYRLLSRPEVQGPEFQQSVLQAIRAKCVARGLSATQQSISDPEVRRRSEKDYDLLQDEIASQLPDFTSAYSAVLQYYEQLPWVTR